MNSMSGKSRQKKCRPSLFCVICGDKARGMNFDVLTCISCKSFFRRNALRSMNLYHCKYQSNCEITLETRRKCSSCRLRKCLEFGMDSRLIRGFSQRDKTIQKSVLIKQQLPTLRPLGLLQNDRSTLVTDEWNLISNILNVYNEQNIVNHIKSLLAQNSSLPIRLRVKTSVPLEYIGKCVSSLQTLIKQSTHFHSLHLDSRRQLIHHNFLLISTFNAAFVSNEVDLWSHTDFGTAYNALLGADYFTQYSILPKRIDPNGILVKLILFIISFSSNYSIVLYNPKLKIKTKSSSLSLIQIQNNLVTVLWKYLVYLYGDTEAIRRYSSLIKTLVDILHELEDVSNSEFYDQLLDTIISQTEKLLILND